MAKRFKFKGGSGNVDDTLVGTNQNDQIDGKGGNDTLSGLGGMDKIKGGKGNDVLIGGAGNDSIDGGKDFDIAKYSGSSSDYRITAGKGGVIVTDLRAGAPDGVDVVRHVEALQFSNETIYIDSRHGRSAPVITSNGGGTIASASIAENTRAVTTVVAADADHGDTKNFSIAGGADAAKFAINARTGALSFISAPNFEAPTDAGANNVYDVVVKVTDSAGLSDTQALAVTVTNVAENAPVITSNGGGVSAALNVAENSIAVTTVVATDADAGDTRTFSIAGGVDAAKFAINAATGALSFVAAPNFEAPTDIGGNNVYDVIVKVTDAAGLSDTQALAVTVTNVAESAPVITSNGGGATAVASIAENTRAVTTVVAADADLGDSKIFTLAGGADAAKFVINAATGALSFIAAPNFEAPTDSGRNNVYDVVVRVTDSAGLSDTQALAVTVTNVAENAPVITSNGGGATASASIAENNSAVTSVAATDADLGDSRTFSLAGGADAAKFTINATTGALSFIAAPNFEAPTDMGGNNVYDVIVKVTDSAGLIDTQALAVTVTNVAENAPVITSNGGGATGAASVAENISAVTTIVATDADLGDTRTFSLAGGADAGKFAINATTGALSFIAAPNFEAPTDIGANNVYDVVVKVTDSAGLSDTQALAVTVTNVAENAPVITSNGGGATATTSVAENTTAVTTVIASDADLGDTRTFSIAGGADAARFQINPTTGALSFIAAPNFEAPTDSGGNNVYDVVVKVADAAGMSDTQAIAVTVSNVNENTNAPVITSNGGGVNAATNVVENRTAVTTVVATDADLGDSRTFSLAGGADAAKFAINATTGALSFITAPNFEAPTDLGGDNVYDVIVKVTDAAGLSDTQALAVTVTDVAENTNAPVITSNGGGATGNVSIRENSSAVTIVAATDADAVDTRTFGLAGGADAAKFAINATTGALSFIAAPDFEAPTDVGSNNVYDVIVKVTDSAGLSDTQALAVTVTNVAENAPVITSNGGGTTAMTRVAENTTAVTTLAASDADPGDTRTFSIAGGADAAKFQINPTTGALSFIAAPNFEAPTDSGGNNVYDVVVKVADAAGLSDTQSIEVTVADVAENAPVIVSNGGGVTAPVSVAENTFEVTTVVATDADLGDSRIYSLAGGADAAKFTINPTTGALSFIAAPDFEAPGDSGANNVYDVVVKVTDAAGLSDTQALAVTVTNVVENTNAPVITSNGGGGTGSVSIAENATAVTVVTATDADIGDVRAFSLDGGADAAKFAINMTTGALSFIAAPNFEAPTDAGSNNVYDVVVKVTDSAGLSDTQALAVTVTNVAENAPVITSNGGGAIGSVSIAENTSAVTTVVATDADLGDTRTFSLAGGTDAAKFAINSATGALSFIAAPDFEAPTDGGANNVYDVIVKVTDAAGLSDTQTLSVTVTNAAEALASIDLATLTPSQGIRIVGVDALGESGSSVSGAGDVNGDGFADVIVGAPYTTEGGKEFAGSSYVVFGGASGPANVNLSTLVPAQGFRMSGAAAYDQSGTSVSAAGDVNGDGFADVIVGAPYATPVAGRDQAGAAYVVFGKSGGFTNIDFSTLAAPPSSLAVAAAASPGFLVSGAAGYDNTGRSVSAAGDVNGDGFGDFIIGAPYAVVAGKDYAGSAYVVYGKAGGPGNVDLSTLTAAQGSRILGCGR